MLTQNINDMTLPESQIAYSDSKWHLVSKFTAVIFLNILSTSYYTFFILIEILKYLFLLNLTINTKFAIVMKFTLHKNKQMRPLSL